MINKNELKYIQSFVHKKQWAQESVFMVEGPKLVAELLNSDWIIEKIYATVAWADKQTDPSLNIQIVDDFELEKMTQLQKPNQVIALVEKKLYRNPLEFKGQFTLVLDGVQDPGNMGTIIRTADWFGCTQIIVSEDSANLYNPKVIQSTMGSFLRVRVAAMDIATVMGDVNLPVYGALLAGSSIYETKFTKEGFLVIGNESKGIRPEINSMVTQAISIPKFGAAESLNAAVATGIILSHWKAQ
jgi:TrmH family RNA methyltransferase